MGCVECGRRGMYLQRNAAALALVRKRGGMQSVAFVPSGGRVRGVTRAMHAAAASAQLASHSVHLCDAAFIYYLLCSRPLFEM